MDDTVSRDQTRRASANNQMFASGRQWWRRGRSDPHWDKSAGPTVCPGWCPNLPRLGPASATICPWHAQAGKRGESPALCGIFCGACKWWCWKGFVREPPAEL